VPTGDNEVMMMMMIIIIIIPEEKSPILFPVVFLQA